MNDGIVLTYDFRNLFYSSNEFSFYHKYFLFYLDRNVGLPDKWIFSRWKTTFWN